MYEDTKEPTVANWRERKCHKCKKPQTKEGHDPCLGTLKAVKNACCGHGNINETYIQFWDGVALYGEQAKTILDRITNK